MAVFADSVQAGEIINLVELLGPGLEPQEDDCGCITFYRDEQIVAVYRQPDCDAIW